MAVRGKVQDHDAPTRHQGAQGRPKRREWIVHVVKGLGEQHKVHLSVVKRRRFEGAKAALDRGLEAGEDLWVVIDGDDVPGPGGEEGGEVAGAHAQVGDAKRREEAQQEAGQGLPGASREGIQPRRRGCLSGRPDALQGEAIRGGEGGRGRQGHQGLLPRDGPHSVACMGSITTGDDEAGAAELGEMSAGGALGNAEYLLHFGHVELLLGEEGQEAEAVVVAQDAEEVGARHLAAYPTPTG